MIHSIRANKPSFKSVTFTDGLNIVLAERTKLSSAKDSRNGLGKTSLIEIIHFCLGASARKGEDLLRNELAGWTFTLELTLREQKYLVERSVDQPNKVFVTGDCNFWPIQPSHDLGTGKPALSTSNWNQVLAWLMFNLDTDKSKESKYKPTFRSLISYFVRKGRDAYSTPFEHFRKQLEWDKQVNNSFLLGIWWEFASQLQGLKDRERATADLQKALKSGNFPELFGASKGDLEAKQVQLEAKLQRQQIELESFQPNEQYEEIQERANALTKQVSEMRNLNFLDQQMIEHYERTIIEENIESPKIERVFSEARVNLPSQVVKQLRDVEAFHKQVVNNRKEYLSAETKRLARLVRDRNASVQTANNELADLMKILNETGSFQAFTQLNQRQGVLQSELNDVKSKLETIRRIERSKSDIRIEQETLLQKARLDHEERKNVRALAIKAFNANSEALYEAPGRLSIDVEVIGYRFHVDIQGDGSDGIEQMKVFCYDLMLANLWTQKNVKPGFLIHDSAIYDGVDERQRALALKLAHELSSARGFQYICCFNSDMIPTTDLGRDFDIDQFVRLRLNDGTASGGLFGFRF